MVFVPDVNKSILFAVFAYFGFGMEALTSFEFLFGVVGSTDVEFEILFSVLLVMMVMGLEFGSGVGGHFHGGMRVGKVIVTEVQESLFDGFSDNAVFVGGVAVGPEELLEVVIAFFLGFSVGIKLLDLFFVDIGGEVSVGSGFLFAL